MEAAEEAVVNALLGARTLPSARDGNEPHALPADQLLTVMRAAGRLA